MPFARADGVHRVRRLGWLFTTTVSQCPSLGLMGCTTIQRIDSIVEKQSQCPSLGLMGCTTKAAAIDKFGR